jgi:arginine utilization regulatory protein
LTGKEYEEILSALSQIVKDGVHVVNSQGRSIIYNEAMSALEKTPRENVIGKPFRKVFAYIPKEESTLSRALNQNISTINKRQTYLNNYGKEVTTINTTIPVINQVGKAIAAIEIAKDITDIENLSNEILDMHQKITEPK